MTANELIYCKSVCVHLRVLAFVTAKFRKKRAGTVTRYAPRRSSEKSQVALTVCESFSVSDSKYVMTFRHTCITCGKDYKHKHHLKRHHDFECGIDPKFKCAFCPHRTRYKDSLMKHILARHQHLLEQNSQYSAHQQPFENQTDNDASLHAQGTMFSAAYSSANWTIPTLPSTSRIAMYTRRLRSMTTNDDGRNGGTGPRKYLCNDCNRTFALKASLMRHKAFECNKGRQPYERQSSEEYEKKKLRKKHVCPQCNRVYAFFTSLWRHQKYECGVEPKFICPICRGRFSQKSNLDRHVRTKH
ncbi:PREDICTED: Krueppel-related zinc finger protein 1-like [Dinoponera quadriceps]|uniref:Krueppel-related zinc finger protein 1-like n=1 Tax=Dinoponera quadriceps TaxID=609295 RepID=A0A6P3X9A3_DINQU|nr:PREDICTED: Krueppel-related zinc finger protein 1-like [Dinoponera quadriceps]